MIIEISCGEGGDAFIVQCIRGGSSRFDNVPLVKLKFHFTGHIPLCGFDERLQSLAKRREPFALIYNLCKFIAKISLESVGVAVKDQFF